MGGLRLQLQDDRKSTNQRSLEESEIKKRGRLYIIGIGPGDQELLTIKAVKALKKSEYIIGHNRYIKLIEGINTDAKKISKGMGKEVERTKMAFDLAKTSIVSLISGGDPAIYGLLGLVVELIMKEGYDVEYEVIPGISAFSVANIRLGCPISNDFVVISLSDLLIPWDVIKKRLEHAILGDFVIAVYNPSSKGRINRFKEAIDLLKKYRPNCWVGIVKNATRNNEDGLICRCQDLEEYADFVDMSTILIVGNSKTEYNDVMITPRGYKL